MNNRLSDEYWRGTEDFINLESYHLNSNGLTRYPCKKCLNRSSVKLSKISAHIIDHCFHHNYNIWFYHDEKEVCVKLLRFSGSGSGSGVQGDDEIVEALVDLTNENNFAHDDDTEPTDQEASMFDTMFAELQSELWPGCTKMSSFKLIHLKFVHKWTNKSFDICEQMDK